MDDAIGIGPFVDHRGIGGGADRDEPENNPQSQGVHNAKAYPYRLQSTKLGVTAA
jgi:hypothetical protein